MRRSGSFAPHSQEQGQTIILVALTIVTLLAMAALAIDVVTLYVAKGEVQRAADAAALVAAKAFVDSGVTSDPTNTGFQTLAQNMATAGINVILPQNKVAGAAPVLVGTPSFDFTTHPGNPQVAVTLQRTGLPIFFARIWRRAAATVTASAKAEAYNPSNSQTATGNYIPISINNIKPLLIPNQDNNGNPFVDKTTGKVTTGEITGQAIPLNDACAPGNPNNPCVVLPKSLTATPGQIQFLPAVVNSNAATLCPSCEGSTDFEHSIECGKSEITNQTSTYSCGGAANNALVNTTSSTSAVRRQGEDGVQCLIHYPSHDTIALANFPEGPMQITAGSGPFQAKLVSTSQSIANFPIIDANSSAQITSANVRVIGFLQAFIGNVTNSGPGATLSLTVTILNIAGCGNNPGTGAPITGRVSPIPVRLIQQ
jgi:hypothetical protein